MVVKLPSSIKESIKYLLKISPVREDIANHVPVTEDIANHITVTEEVTEDIANHITVTEEVTEVTKHTTITDQTIDQPAAIDVMDQPSLSGKFVPYQSAKPYYILEKQNLPEDNLLNLPIPPQHLWEGYGETSEAFLASGEEHVGKMRTVLEHDEFKFEPGQRVMELGCAAARMTRWLEEEAKHSEVWGVDICAEHIMWCQQNLSPPFHFSTNTTEPHLPFADEYFNFIYAGSVFTHISELADAWLLELKRILKKGGRLYITVHDNKTIRILNALPDFWLTKQLSEFDTQTNVLSSNFAQFSITRSPKGAQVFYDLDYFQKKVSRWYKLNSITEEAYGYQTAILLQKD